MSTASIDEACQQQDPPSAHRLTRRAMQGLMVMFLLAGAVAWESDFFTATGERTVYTADCAGGRWVGNHCTGQLAAGPRYRFRALRAHGEVLFWTVGTTEPSGKFTGCQVDSGRNWSCPANADSARSVAMGMVRGNPVPDPQHRTRPLHSVSKLNWMALQNGIAFSSNANE